jgi:signal transduction histidine kinase
MRTTVLARVGTWTLTRRLRVALGAFAALLLLSVLALSLAVRQADRALADQTQRIFPARVAASQLLTALVDQETGLRGYVITHDDSYLVPYRQGLADEKRLRATLDTLIKRSDPARLNLITVDSTITAWHQEYAALRLLDVQTGSATTTIGFGRQLFDELRRSNQDLDRRLTAQVRTAQQRADRDRLYVVVVLGLTAVAVAAALLGLLRALGRNVLEPLADLGQQVEVVSKGTHLIAIEPVGPPDLRDMGAGVESMRQELVRALSEVEEAQRDLEHRAAELARSNADLEQFAYVASHDLQEPLRKVASFCQLLEERYADQLDERGLQYITFAVDGARRMQRLITDLLTFSRVGRTSEGFTAVDLRATVQHAWAGLDERVQEVGAELEWEGPERTVHGDPSLLQLLVTNLLGNALKYRHGDRAPRVRVSTSEEDGLVRVDVADNGIGIADKYADKVFVIFQRLHGREEYEGTGIGLALCKKVVEFHGGTIELRPSPLDGTCVSFTLPQEPSADA